MLSSRRWLRSARRACAGLGALATNCLVTALAATCLATAGCAGHSAFGGGHAGAAEYGELLLFPLDVVAPLPAGTEAGAASVDAEIRRYLEDQDRRVHPVPPEEARSAWLASAQALKSEVGAERMSFEGGAATLARRLHGERRFDALVLPWIALAPAKVRGRTVTWDGVTRTLRVVNPQGRSLKVLKDFQAQAAAPSLHVAVFAPDGRKLFEGSGGLDLLHALVLEGEPTRIGAELLPRAQIFADRTPVYEGIAVAFDPFLPRP